MIKIIVQTREAFKNRRSGEKNENRCYVDEPMSVFDSPVPRPHFSSRPKRFGSLGPCENVRPRQKSSKVRQLNGDGIQDQSFEFQSKKYIAKTHRWERNLKANP